MIREMIDYYAKKTLNPKFQELVPRAEYQSSLKNKLDSVIFNNHVSQMLAKDAKNNKEF